MVLGDNGILQKATTAKEKMGRASVIEQAKTDILAYQVENKGGNIDKEQLKSVLDSYFKEVPEVEELPDGEALLNQKFTTLEKYGTHQIAVSEIYDVNLTPKTNLKIGDVVTNYTSNTQLPEGTEWIYFGEDDEEHKLLTTSKPINGIFSVNGTAQEWLTLENGNSNINTVCAVYKNNQAITARSMTLEDINRVTGFKEEEHEFDRYKFRSGDINFPFLEVNYWYPSLSEASNASHPYWKEPTSEVETIPCDAYSYYKNGNKIYYSGQDNDYEDEEITGINIENLNYILGVNEEFSYCVATHMMSFAGDSMSFIIAGVDEGTIGTDWSLCKGYSDKKEDRGNLGSDRCSTSNCSTK